MASVGKTQQYKGLSNTVKNVASPEQKKTISVDTINQLFSDFGYQPEKSDITYWSNQPEETKTKLVNDLKARQDEEKEANKLKQSQNQGPSHLTDQQITKLYSEYGFPTPKSGGDFEWIRKNFPDDEEKMRSILDIKRKQTDQLLKLQGQNTLNTVKQKTQMNSNNNSGVLMGPQFTGQGGPSDQPTDGATSGTKLIFPSRYAVVKFSGDPNGNDEGDSTTLWLLDSQNKQLQPFLSMNAFNKVFGDNAQNVLKKVATFDPNDLLSTGSLSGFNLLNTTYGIDDNGNIPVPDINQNSIKSLYGQQSDPQAVTSAYSALDGYMGLLKTNNGSGISSSIIDSALNDHNQVAKYISALAYGGYTLNDVYSDLKRKELVMSGDNSLKTIQTIDPNLTKQQYLQTNNGQLSQSIPTIQPPTMIGEMNSSILNSPITQLPSEAFKTLVPTIDINSPDFKEQMDKVQSAFHDILLDQVNATSESEKALADSKYKDYVNAIQQNYGIRISMNSAQAWQQLQQLANQGEQAGIAGSGIESGQIADELRQTRTQDERWRAQSNKDEESAALEQASSSASPEDIQRMNQEDAAKGLSKSEWRTYRAGLTPSDEVIKSLDINTLKRNYPDQSVEDLQRMRDQILDENGNYRSSVYQNKTDKINTYKYGDTLANNFKTIGSLQDFKEKTVFDKNLKKQEEASAPYTMTDPNKPFDTLGTTKTSVPVTVPKNLTSPYPNQNLNNSVKDNLSDNNFTVNKPDSANAANTIKPLVTAGSPKATLVNSAGKKVVVQSGSSDASNYFKQGYKLMK